MPSTRHELLRSIARDDPLGAVDLLTLTGSWPPDFDSATVEPADLTDLVPTEYHADLVITLHRNDQPVLSIVIEVQLGPDEEKQFTWPAYLVNQRRLARHPTILLVICISRKLAQRCARPIETGHPGFVLVPLVLHPDRIPHITEPARAEDEPLLAILSALAHTRDRGVLRALPSALFQFNGDTFTNYYRLIEAALPPAARRYLEDLMTASIAAGTPVFKSEVANKLYAAGRAEGQAEGREEGKAEGQARGEATAVVEFLIERGVPVLPAARDRILGCDDLDQLARWVRAAVTVESTDDLFKR